MATFWVVVDQKGITVTIKWIFLESDLIKMVCLHPIRQCEMSFNRHYFCHFQDLDQTNIVLHP